MLSRLRNFAEAQVKRAAASGTVPSYGEHLIWIDGSALAQVSALPPFQSGRKVNRRLVMITTADGVKVDVGQVVFDYYNMLLGEIITEADDTGWFRVRHLETDNRELLEW